MDHADSELAGILREVDLPTLGGRLRNARLARGLTQTEVAGGDVSTAYISRIESGQRRPDLQLLGRLGERLGTSLEELLLGTTSRRRAEVQLDLDHAELALVSGDAGTALQRVDEAVAALTDRTMPDLLARARLLRARCLEATGSMDEAILALEDLVDDAAAHAVWLPAAIALCRCYRESGDLARAVDTGEAALRDLAARGLDGTDESVQLAVTLAAAHFERGDVAHAVRQCQRAVERAEQIGSPTARASAYWNASIMTKEQGDVAAAVAMAQKALALLELADDNRNLARLRSQLGITQLHLDPPDIDAARSNLEHASRGLEWSSAAPVDLARNRLALARAHYLAGELAAAAEGAGAVLEETGEIPMLAAEAWVLRGQVRGTEGDLAGAAECYREAAMRLTAVGADRGTAQLWFELGHLLEVAGDPDAARDAYRRAAASTGLRVTRPTVPGTVPGTTPSRG